MEISSLEYFTNLKNLYENIFRDKLKTDHFIQQNLKFLEKAINKSKKVFTETGSFSFCAMCAKSGEKCCLAGLKWKLSPAEFWINLLLAEENNQVLRFNLERPEDCLFLGENGCMLILTPLFCRNFFCDKLQKFLGHKNLVKIQKTMEEEAKLSFMLSDYITWKYILPYSHLFKK